MEKPYDTRLIMMVAQQPFERERNKFCKLIPIVYVDGMRPDSDDFPNDGEIWWMLTAQTEKLAEPGRLIVGMVEDAERYDRDLETSSRYQVIRESVDEVYSRHALDVIDIREDIINDMIDVVSGGFTLNMPVRPTQQVMFRWKSYVYGPFTVTRSAQDQLSFTFSPANTAEMTVYQISESEFNEATKGNRVIAKDFVSLTSQRRHGNLQLAEVKHDLLLAEGYEKLRAKSPQKLDLEPIDQKLKRFAKQCLTKKKRQELQKLLEELEITGRETEPASILAAIKRVRNVTETQAAALDAVARALLESGMMGEERIKKAEQVFADKYVQDRTAEQQAKIEENLKTKRDELGSIEAELNNLQTKLRNEEIRHRAKLDNELIEERKKALKAIDAERAEFEKEKEELSRQQTLLQQNLKEVTTELRDAGDVVVNRFLTIAPLLGAMGLTSVQDACDHRSALPEGNLIAPLKTFEMPAFVTGRAELNDGSLSEEEFFDRFCRVVEDSGFRYRPLDLQRFHLSVKCGDLTVLGGPSGTGKSSLPVLYTQALLGDEASNDRPACLMVNIGPSWMDIRDLVGHMNTLDGRFYPAESGLFQHIIYAQEEYNSRGRSTGLYMTCLDEMNLAQVEHYFSDFMMAFDRGNAGRAIKCFSPEVASNNCPFRGWGEVMLSPALRFVGTVNIDETTRLLSDRLYDRVNYIRLTTEDLPDATGSNTPATATGRMVRLADFETWRDEITLPSDLGTQLDKLRPILKNMGYPISPRIYKGIWRFVKSSLKIMTAEKAFDVQLAQRVIPKIRNLMTNRQRTALDDLLDCLRESSTCSFEESITLLEEIQETAGMQSMILEE